jgi:hypothetical protein
MLRFISQIRKSERLWYGLLAILIAIDVVTLIDHRGNFMVWRIYYSVGPVSAAILVAILCGALLTFWRWRNQKIAHRIQWRKFMLAWCRGALRGGLFALLLMPLLIYEEFEGPGFIISVIHTLQGCTARACFGLEYMFGALMVASVIPFGLGLTAAIVSARKSWRNCIAAEMTEPESP